MYPAAAERLQHRHATRTCGQVQGGPALAIMRIYTLCCLQQEDVSLTSVGNIKQDVWNNS